MHGRRRMEGAALGESVGMSAFLECRWWGELKFVREKERRVVNVTRPTNNVLPKTQISIPLPFHVRAWHSLI